MIYDDIKSLLEDLLPSYFSNVNSGLPDDFTYEFHSELEYGIKNDAEIVIKVLPADIQLGVRQIPIEVFFDCLEEHKDSILKALNDLAKDCNETTHNGFKYVVKTPSVLSIFQNGGFKKRCLISMSMTLLEMSNVFNVAKLEFSTVESGVTYYEELNFIRFDFAYAADAFSSGGMNANSNANKGITKTIVKHQTNSYSITALVSTGETYKYVGTPPARTTVYTNNYYLKLMIINKLKGQYGNKQYTLRVSFTDNTTLTIPCVVTVLGFSGTQREIPIVNITFMRNSL